MRSSVVSDKSHVEEKLYLESPFKEPVSLRNGHSASMMSTNPGSVRLNSPMSHTVASNNQEHYSPLAASKCESTQRNLNSASYLSRVTPMKSSANRHAPTGLIPQLISFQSKEQHFDYDDFNSYLIISQKEPRWGSIHHADDMVSLSYIEENGLHANRSTSPLRAHLALGYLNHLSLQELVQLSSRVEESESESSVDDSKPNDMVRLVEALAEMIKRPDNPDQRLHIFRRKHRRHDKNPLVVNKQNDNKSSRVPIMIEADHDINTVLKYPIAKNNVLVSSASASCALPKSRGANHDSVIESSDSVELQLKLQVYILFVITGKGVLLLHIYI